MASNKSNAPLYTYYAILFVFSLSLFYLFDRLTRGHAEDHLYTEKLILCVVSSFFNLFVLYYHFTNAPHPKFVILKRRKFFILLHIVSGVTEFWSCCAAFYTGNPQIATVAALAAILGHIPSAYYQTSIVFGAKAVMVTGYLFAISLHLFCSLHLLLDPASVYWLLNMFLVHNIYVWCRVFYTFFVKVGLFTESKYTNAIMVSGLLLFPAVIGVAGNLFFFAYVATSVVLYFVIVRPTPYEISRYVNECSRDVLINKKTHDTWVKERARLVQMQHQEKLTDEQKAREVFNSLDKDKNGTIDGDEILDLVKSWEATPNFMKRFQRWSKTKPITFDFFYKNIWHLGETAQMHVKEGEQKRGEAKARFIFEHLDADSSGYIDGTELQQLLIQWGLPDNEVDAYLATDDDKRYSFEEFYNNMKPIWDFAYDHMTVREVQGLAHSHAD